MHLLFLSDNFPPEVNAPASRTFEHCREWVRCGHRVTVITCAPNFPKGEVYAGYSNRLLARERMDGIEVIRVWTFITANEGFAKRILDYVSFMVMAVPAALLVGKVDVIIGTSPQFFTVCGACIAGWLKRVPFIFELRDIWPESVKAVGAMGDSVFIRFFEKIEMLLYRRAARIVSVTESFKKTLVARGVDGEKIKVVTNGVDLSRFSPQEKDGPLLREHGLEGKFVAGYIGTHGMAHGLETLLRAAKVFQDRGDDRVRFLFLGHGARKKALIEEARTMGLANVLFIDSVPKEEVARYWSLLDVAVIHLRKTPLFTTVIPSKLFECMGMGIPVLHGVAGESAAIVERTGCGLPFEPENSDELVAKLDLMRQESETYQELRRNCLRGAPQFERNALARKMLAIIEKVGAGGGKIRMGSGLNS